MKNTQNAFANLSQSSAEKKEYNISNGKAICVRGKRKKNHEKTTKRFTLLRQKINAGFDFFFKLFFFFFFFFNVILFISLFCSFYIEVSKYTFSRVVDICV